MAKLKRKVAGSAAPPSKKGKGAKKEAEEDEESNASGSAIESEDLAPKKKTKKAAKGKKSTSTRDMDWDAVSDEGWEDAPSEPLGKGAMIGETGEELSAGEELSTVGRDGKEIRQVHISGLPWTATEEELRDMFKGFGEIESIALPPKYTHVLYKEAASASKAVEEMGDAAIGEKKLKIKLDRTAAKLQSVAASGKKKKAA